MIADMIFAGATSDAGLVMLCALLGVSLVLGYMPLLQYLPVLGPYKYEARLVAALSLALLCFLLGYRVSDDRETVKNLRAELQRREADLAIASKSAADANQKAKDIEAASYAQAKTDSEYIASLQALPACSLTAADLADGVRKRPAGGHRFGFKKPAAAAK